jgi:hypothetical protein
LKPVDALVNISFEPMKAGAKSDEMERVAHAASTKVQSKNPSPEE